MTAEEIKPIIEAALLAAGRPLDVEQLSELFVTPGTEDDIAGEERQAVRKPIRQALKALAVTDESRGVELVEVASGYRFQVKPAFAKQVKNLWASRPSRYSRALLETLALIAYRQPITRGEIEKVRGVSVSTQIIKNLIEFGWVRIVGHRNSPGRPMLYGTTKTFLDHFSLKSLEDLPPLAELQEAAQNDAALLKESGDLDLLSADGDFGTLHASDAAVEVPGHEADLSEVAEELAAAANVALAEEEEDPDGTTRLPAEDSEDDADATAGVPTEHNGENLPAVEVPDTENGSAP